MAPIVPSSGGDAPADDLDNLFDYHVDLENVFRDVDVNMDMPGGKQSAQSEPKVNRPELGIDEEVKITRKRQPVPKLDEDRLLSQAGIPKLRRIARERFEFKGKGHEYRDLARLLNIYQLWLDDLYPRAKFADGLAMIEKLGHKKRIQIMRREWINEGKPRDKFADIDLPQEAQYTFRASTDQTKAKTAESQDKPLETSNIQPTPAPSNEDLYTASPRCDARASVAEAETLFLSDDEMHDEPPEDDLDVLLAETGNDHEGKRSLTSEYPVQSEDARSRPEHDFEDDMEALAAMEEM